MPFPSKITPEAVLEAAQSLLEGGGPQALSMRALAEALGVKAPSLYRHFADRAALERALAGATALRLREGMLQASAGRKPKGALRDAAGAYLNFARSSPALYDLLLAQGQSGQPALHTEAGKHLWNTVLALVGAVSGDPDDTAGAVALWAFLHGFVALERAGQFGVSGPQGGFEIGLEALIASFARR